MTEEEMELRIYLAEFVQCRFKVLVGCDHMSGDFLLLQYCSYHNSTSCSLLNIYKRLYRNHKNDILLTL